MREMGPPFLCCVGGGGLLCGRGRGGGSGGGGVDRDEPTRAPAFQHPITPFSKTSSSARAPCRASHRARALNARPASPRGSLAPVPFPSPPPEARWACGQSEGVRGTSLQPPGGSNIAMPPKSADGAQAHAKPSSSAPSQPPRPRATSPPNPSPSPFVRLSIPPFPPPSVRPCGPPCNWCPWSGSWRPLGRRGAQVSALLRLGRVAYNFCMREFKFEFQTGV